MDHLREFPKPLTRDPGERLSQLYFVLDRLGLENGAFKQLTCEYMREEFNPKTPNIEDVRYALLLRINKATAKL